MRAVRLLECSMEPASPPLCSVRWPLAGVVLLTALGAIGSLCDGFNEDELQHLHAAWLVGHGLIPYRDYYDHHPPGYHLLFAPLTLAFAHSPASLLLTARVCALAVTAAILASF